jgi:GntR family transcriptional regulator
MSADNIKIKINKSSPVPMYQQILNEISAHIASGEWPAGTQLPTEAEFESQLQVSRVTIRQALSAAAEEGLVVRPKGLSATSFLISAAVSTFKSCWG